MATNIIITRATAQAAESLAHASPHPEWQLYTAAGVGLIFAVLLWKPFFKDWSGFWECIKFWLKPDWISWFQGQGFEDTWAEFKLGVWVAISVICAVLSYFELPKWLPGVFGS